MNQELTYGVQAPPKKPVKKILTWFLLLLAVLVLGGYLYYRFELSTPASKDDRIVSFLVVPGQGIRTIADNLETAGLVRSKLIFELLTMLMGKQAMMKAGEHQLHADWNVQQVASALISGDTIDRTQDVKFIEGWTAKEMGNYLETKKMMTEKDWLTAVGYPMRNYEQDGDFPPYEQFRVSDYPLLADKPAKYGYEGYLFPDTYQVYKNSAPRDIMEKMLDNLEKKITPQMRNDMRSQGKSFYDILTMASIIQKEVRSPEEMKIVSDIFWSRIKVGQPLQSCASLAYILGENKKQYSYEDTRIDSIYNTYLHRGLPPGPIANPGLDAITAAIYPAHTEFGYFLTRSDTGETVFSRTLEEHNAAKAKYLK